MSDTLYRHMALPAACALDVRVPKKTLVSNADLTPADKRAISEDIEAIVWRFALKPDTILVRPYVDDEREYLEVAILEAALRSRRRTRRIAEVIQRAIPYPVLLVLKNEADVALSAAHKRFSRAEKGAIVVEEVLLSAWIDTAGPTRCQLQFLESLHSSGIRRSDLFGYYSDFVERLVALDAAILTGAYRVLSGKQVCELRRRRLGECRALAEEIASRRIEIKREVRFSSRVELSLEIKNLQARLDSTVRELNSEPTTLSLCDAERAAMTEGAEHVPGS